MIPYQKDGVTPLTLRPMMLTFLLISGMKRTEFSLKTGHFSDLKPYNKFPTMTGSIKRIPTQAQRLHDGVHTSMGHSLGLRQQ